MTIDPKTIVFDQDAEMEAYIDECQALQDAEMEAYGEDWEADRQVDDYLLARQG